MAIRYSITSQSGFSGTTPIIDYTISIYDDQSGFGGWIYKYNRRAVYYSYGGQYLPSYSDVQSQASDFVSKSKYLSCSTTLESGLVCSVSNGRLTSVSSAYLNDGRSLGAYLSSSPQDEILFDAPCGAVLHRVRHHFERGIIYEYFNTFWFYVNRYSDHIDVACEADFDSIEILSTYTCNHLVVKVAITDSRSPTDCCVTACCYPDLYYLV